MTTRRRLTVSSRRCYRFRYLPAPACSYEPATLQDSLAARRAVAARRAGGTLRLLLLLAFAATACERDIELTLPPTPTPASTAVIAVPGGTRCAESAVLADPTTSDDEKLAAIRRLAADRGDDPTRCLIAATSHPSALVAMASIQGLSGRPCALIERPVVPLLDHDDWQRRAWAAKVLGDTGCVGAVSALVARREREDDARVRARLDAALATLDPRHDGA
jgi:hypothetical protein